MEELDDADEVGVIVTPEWLALSMLLMAFWLLLDPAADPKLLLPSCFRLASLAKLRRVSMLSMVTTLGFLAAAEPEAGVAVEDKVWSLTQFCLHNYLSQL